MKRCIRPVIPFIAAAAVVRLAAQESIPVDSKVVSATVFQSRAMVTRQAELRLEAGTVRLVMDGLTPGLLDESVRLSGEGTAGVKILDVKVETAYSAEIQEKEIRLLQAKLDSLDFEIRAVNDGKSVFETQKAFIESIRMEYPKEINQKLAVAGASVQEWKNALSFFDSQLTSIYAGMRNAQKKLDGMAKKREALEKEMQERRSARGDATSRKKITATAEVEKAGRLSLTASYLIPGASWHPVYDARVNSADGKMDWTFGAMVGQNTGEDWEDVRLSLSTAQPMQYGTIPELSPWYLDIARPRPEKASRRMGEMAPAPMIQAAAEAEPNGLRDDEKRPLEFSQAEVETNFLSTVFAVPARNDIPSAKDYHKITISMRQLPCAFEYTAVPKAQEKTFVRGRAVNKTDAPFLPGEVSVFLDGDFINKTRIPTVVPSDTMKLALGGDDAVQAGRKFINRFTEGKGILGGKKRVTDEYEIRVVNNRRNEIAVSVFDQLPISQNEKISVRLLAPGEKEVIMDQAGQIEWRLRLKPGEKRILPLKYQVEFPGDAHVQGL